MIHSFLIIGQSNMAGRGIIGDVPPIIDERMLVLRNLRWVRLWEPVNPDRSFSGVCLATSFAKCFIDQHPDDKCGIIPCADGGTRLDEWQKGTDLYENAVFQTVNAQKISTLSGILWHQGEGDCPDSLYKDYTNKFIAMITALKKDINAPDVPVFVGGLGDYLLKNPSPAYTNMPEINKQLAALGERDNIYYVSAKGLGCKSDLLHFNSHALREFGNRYYSAFSSMSSLTDDMITTFVASDEGESELLENIKQLVFRFKEGLITQEEFLSLKEELIKNA